MTSPPCPYTNEELFNDDNPSLRDLHKDVNKFWRNVMRLQTPLQGDKLPKVHEVTDAIMNTAKDSNINKILYDLRATPLLNLWPKGDGPSASHPTSIGVLWLACQKAIPSDKTHESKLKDPNTNYLSLDYCLDPKNGLVIDSKTYFSLLQDPGFEVKTNKRPKKCYINEDKITGKTLAYNNIYTLALSYYDILWKHKETFQKLPKNKSAVIQKICKFIFDNRALEGFADIQDQSILNLIEEVMKSTNKDEPPQRVYLYDQDYLFSKLYNIWCPLGIERKETTQNDKLRVFGIMLSNEMRDEMGSLSRGKSTTRDDLDNPELRVSKIYKKFALAFNDENVVIQHPEHYGELQNANTMDPNELSRINIKRDGVWVQKVFNNVMKHYRPAMHRYKFGTGNGPGGGSNFVDWRLRNPWEFQKYDKVRGSLLAWIFMKDEEQKWILDAKSEDIPKNIHVETTNLGNTHVNNNRRSPTMNSITELGKQIKDFETMSNDFFNKRQNNTAQTIKMELDSDQTLQIKLDNIEKLKMLSSLYGNDPEKQKKFDKKIDSLIEEVFDMDADNDSHEVSKGVQETNDSNSDARVVNKAILEADHDSSASGN